MNNRPVTIVVPVYADWSSLKDCISSLKKYVDTKHKVMLVNDCGPKVDEIEANIKQAIAGFENFEYFRNEKNLGFIGTCNRAVFELDDTENDVLLLNSDTEVTAGFLTEMQEVLYARDQFGVVTPRSNNASIFTLPLSSALDHGIDMKESYRLYKKMKKYLPRYNEMPIAHGFCMLTRRSLINEYGLFDEVFGKGYGEEVDYCMRLINNGYKCVASNHAYVFHLEGRSFSVEKKNEILDTNLKILWKRHPEYRQSVRDYMEEAVPKEIEIEKKIGYIHPTEGKPMWLHVFNKKLPRTYLFSRSIFRKIRKIYIKLRS